MLFLKVLAGVLLTYNIKHYKNTCGYYIFYIKPYKITAIETDTLFIP